MSILKWKKKIKIFEKIKINARRANYSTVYDVKVNLFNESKDKNVHVCTNNTVSCTLFEYSTRLSFYFLKETAKFKGWIESQFKSDI